MADLAPGGLQARAALALALALSAPLPPAPPPPVPAPVVLHAPPVLMHWQPPVIRYAPSYYPALPWRAGPVPSPFRGGPACPPGGG